MRARRPGSAGYALFELLAVLAIMALVAAVALPASIGQVGGLTLDADARALASGIRRLREQAADMQVDLEITAPDGGSGQLPEIGRAHV